MRVVIPSPLFSYTGGQTGVDGAGDTLARLLDAAEISRRRYTALE